MEDNERLKMRGGIGIGAIVVAADVVDDVATSGNSSMAARRSASISDALVNETPPTISP
jgi:hypothetical protein